MKTHNIIRLERNVNKIRFILTNKIIILLKVISNTILIIKTLLKFSCMFTANLIYCPREFKSHETHVSNQGPSEE